jgi:hypothetical protein
MKKLSRLIFWLFQDVIFAAGGDPVKKEKTMPHNIPLGEARKILGLSESTSIDEVLYHEAKPAV